MVGKQPVGSTISSLLSACSPVAVFWAVVLAVVASFNGMPSTWHLSHVAEKSLKGLEPSVANLNAPAAVVVVSDPILVCASTDDRNPDAVLRAFGQAVCFECSGRGFALQTSTTSRTASQASRTNDTGISALTNALPMQATVTVHSGESDNFKTAELAICQVGILVCKDDRLGDRMDFSHDVNLQSGLQWLEPRWCTTTNTARAIYSRFTV